MSKNKIFIFANMLIFSIFIMSCSSQEYTTAKLAIQQSDFSKASEWLPKAMEVEPDNPEIPMVMAIEIHAQNEDWNEMIALFDRAMGINSEKVVEIRGAFISVKDAVSNYVEFYWAKEFNEGVAQFVFIRGNESPEISYAKRKGKYMKQKGVTLPKV